MPNFIENLGLDALTETDEDFNGLLGIVAQQGEPIVGYYGYPYLNMDFGDAQFIVRTEMNKEGDGFIITGLDTHSSGNCVWKTRISAIAPYLERTDKTARRCVLKRSEDGGGMVIVNIVNADVLPSFLEDDEVVLQMVGFPTLMEYYPDEESYANSQPEAEDGKKWLVAGGAIIPTGFLQNHYPKNPEFDKHPELDDLAVFHGTVKELYWGVTEFGGKKHNTYLRCIVETQYGDLELIHTIKQIDESQRQFMKKGSVVSGVLVLSGDAAIYEYEHGIVCDEEHNLQVLRYTFAKGDPNRLRGILCDDTVYFSDANKKEYHGKDEIIDHFCTVHEGRKDAFFARMATITSVDIDTSTPPNYAVGKRCVVLADTQEDNYVSIAFIETNNDGRITKLHVSTDSRYHFACDRKPTYPNPLKDAKPPEDVTEPILMRARFNNIIRDDIADESILSQLGKCTAYRNNAEWMLDALCKKSQENDEAALRNIFGYLFVKAIEYTESSNRHSQHMIAGSAANYTPDDALKGIVHTGLGAAEQEKIQAAFELGKQFYKDFMFFSGKNELESKEFANTLIRALKTVQLLGELYTDKCLHGRI